MLTLTLVRHAKSSHGDPDVKDFDRPLDDRGKRQVTTMAGMLRHASLTPDLILCSTARRTRQTLNRLLKDWHCQAEIVFDGRLYLATAEHLRALLEKSMKPHQHIMLVGHNPGLHLLAFSLAERGDPALIGSLADNFPTLAICCLRFEGDSWKSLANGELVLYTTPKLAGLDDAAYS